MADEHASPSISRHSTFSPGSSLRLSRAPPPRWFRHFFILICASPSIEPFRALGLSTELRSLSDDFVVLCDLVCGSPRPLLRPGSKDLAYVPWPQSDYRMRSAPQHTRGLARRFAKSLGGLSSFSHAVLRLELFRAREGAQFLPDIFATPGRDADGGCALPRVLRHGGAAKALSHGLSPIF